MTVFSPRLEILPPAQRKLWSDLAPASRLGLVLYGGTAVALRLGHRSSVDFDFFSDHPLGLAVLREAFGFLRRATVLLQEANSLTVLVEGKSSGETVKLSFFGGLKTGRVGHPSMTDDGFLEVASLDDLMATKLKVIMQRSEAKDYRDLAAMIASGADLGRGLAAASRLYGAAFQPSVGLKALTYFGDGDLESLPAREQETLIAAAAAIRDLPSVRRRSTRLSARIEGTKRR